MLLITVPKHLLPVVAVADVFNALIMAFIQFFANTRNLLHVLAITATASALDVPSSRENQEQN